MAKRFEQLVIWQRARTLVSACFDLIERDELRNMWSFKNQMASAALSVMNNIAEGFERGGNQEFIHFLGIAKASAGEVRSMFYVMLDRRWITDEEFKTLHGNVVGVSSGIQGLIRHLKRSDFQGDRKRTDQIRDADDLHYEADELDDSWFSLEETPPN